MFGAVIPGAVEFAQDTDYVAPNIGAAAGTSTASATSQAISASPGASAGVATCSAVGRSTRAGVGLAEGTSAFINLGGPTLVRPLGVITAVIGAAGASSGVASCAAVGTRAIQGVGASSGTSTCTAVGRSTRQAPGASAGVAACVAVGRSTWQAVGASTGASVASGSDTVVLSGSGASSGAAVCAGVGRATRQGAGSSAGVATCVAVGRSTWQAVGTSAGAATCVAVGRSTRAAAGSAAGTSSATAVGRGTDACAGTAAGVATAVGVPASPHGGAAGTSNVVASGIAVKGTVGSAAGTATAHGVGLESKGISAGAGTASAVGRAVYAGLAMAAGVALVAAIGTRVVGAAGTAHGTSIAHTVAPSHGVSEGHSTATSVVRNSSVAWGTLTFTANGTPIKTQSGHLIEGLNNTPSTLTFTVFAAGAVDIGDVIVVAYGAYMEQRYFTGRVIRVQTVRNVDDTVRYQVTAVDKSWVMAQRNFSGFYQGAGGYAGDRRLRFQNATEADALTKLTALDGKSWRVDAYDNIITFVYDTTASPEPITLSNESMENVAIEESAEQHVNRVYASGFGSSSVERAGNYIAFQNNVPDMSGRVLINNTFRGSMSQSQIWCDLSADLNQVVTPSVGACVAGVVYITATFTTNYGETGSVPVALSGLSGQVLAAGDKLTLTPNYGSLVGVKPFNGLFGVVQQINFYVRQQDIVGGFTWYEGYLGSLPIDGTGTLEYNQPASALNGQVPLAGEVNGVASLLMGVLTMDEDALNVSVPDETQQVNVAVEEVVNDTVAQAAFAARFLGDGVLSASISDGSWNRADCTQAGNAELAKYQGPLKYLLSYTSRDPEVHPGRVVRVTGYPTLYTADYVIGQDTIVFDRTWPPLPPLVSVSNAGVVKPQGHVLFENRFRQALSGSTGVSPTVFPSFTGAGTPSTIASAKGAAAGTAAGDADGSTVSPGSGTFRLKFDTVTYYPGTAGYDASIIGTMGDEFDAIGAPSDGKLIRFEVPGDASNVAYEFKVDGLVYLDGSPTGTPFGSLPVGFQFDSVLLHFVIDNLTATGSGKRSQALLSDSWVSAVFHLKSSNDGFYNGWAEGWVNRGVPEWSGEGTKHMIYTYAVGSLSSVNGGFMSSFISSESMIVTFKMDTTGVGTGVLDVDALWIDGTYST